MWFVCTQFTFLCHWAFLLGPRPRQSQYFMADPTRVFPTQNELALQLVKIVGELRHARARTVKSSEVAISLGERSLELSQELLRVNQERTELSTEYSRRMGDSNRIYSQLSAVVDAGVAANTPPSPEEARTGAATARDPFPLPDDADEAEASSSESRATRMQHLNGLLASRDAIQRDLDGLSPDIHRLLQQELSLKTQIEDFSHMRASAWSTAHEQCGLALKLTDKSDDLILQLALMR